MRIVLNLFFIAVSTAVLGQANYDEAKVPAYTLPDPLLAENGKQIKRASQWEKQRRPEILSLFEQHVYGKTLGNDAVTHEVIAVDKRALGGMATRKEVAIYPTPDKSRPIHVLIYL